MDIEGGGMPIFIDMFMSIESTGMPISIGMYISIKGVKYAYIY